MDSILYSKLLDNEGPVSEEINLIKDGYCKYNLRTGILSRYKECPVYRDTRTYGSNEVHFIINRFSHSLNTTYIGYWNCYRICQDSIWFEYLYLPNMTTITAKINDYINSLQ